MTGVSSSRLSYMQEDRERMVVRRLKFEDPRPEQIQDLEVGLFIEEQVYITPTFYN